MVYREIKEKECRGCRDVRKSVDRGRGELEETGNRREGN